MADTQEGCCYFNYAYFKHYFMHSVKHCNAEFTTGLFKKKDGHRSSSFFASSTNGHREATRQEGIDVQYRQSESDGESHRTSFMMDPIEFFSYRSRDKHTYTLHNVINENIITI